MFSSLDLLSITTAHSCSGCQPVVFPALLNFQLVVVQRVERWTCDQQIVGLIPARGKAA